MAVYDKAYDLANDLKNSPEYMEYMRVKKEVEAEPTSKKMLVDFMRKQYELQTRQMMGEQISPAEMDKFKELASVVQLNRTVTRYLEAEQRIAVLLQDVQKILFDKMEVGFKEVFEGLNKGQM